MTPATPGPVSSQAGGKPRGRGELLPRVGSALVMAAAAMGVTWIGGLFFDLFWLAAGLAVLWEWLGLVGVARSAATVLPGAVALGAATLLAGAGRPGAALAAVALGIVCTAFAVGRPRGAMAAGGVAYAGALVVAAPLLRQSDPLGFAAVIWLFAVVWGTDTMAFFGGRLIGGPKLAPRLSPSKTWSGFFVGVASGAVLGLLVAPHSGCPTCVMAAGVAGGVLAQVGDLFESSLKRRFGAKDAGSLIPGHGGVMDRLDGFIAASVFAAAVGLWRFGPAGAGAGLLTW